MSPNDEAALPRLQIGLGLFSVGLGLAELVAPRRLGRLVGIGDRSSSSILTRLCGLRELAVGLGLLGGRRARPWLWARVGGDVVDIALLLAAGRKAGVRSSKLSAALAAVVGVTALDAYAASTAPERAPSRAARPVRAAVTIAVTPERAYAFWRDLRNLPSFMERLASVELLASGRSRWQLRGPMRRALGFEAEVSEDRPTELIAWRSVDGAAIPNRGEVRFREAPGGRGVEIAVTVVYHPPVGELGHVAALATNQVIAVQLERDLRRLKQLLELGEIIQSDASARRGRHPARPSGEARVEGGRP